MKIKVKSMWYQYLLKNCTSQTTVKMQSDVNLPSLHMRVHIQNVTMLHTSTYLKRFKNFDV